MKRFDEIEGIRGISAALIVLYHGLSTWFNDPDSLAERITHKTGFVALGLLFAVSGFVLYRPVVVRRLSGGSPFSARRFYVRRLARIGPPYWVALTVLAVYPGLTRVFSEDWWVYYGMLQGWNSAWFPHGIPPAWSLGAELIYYASLPLWAAAMSWVWRRYGEYGIRIEIGALVVVGTASLAFRILAMSSNGADQLTVTFPATALWICAGMFLAVLSVARPTAVRAHPMLAGAAAITAVVVVLGPVSYVGDFTVWSALLATLGVAVPSVLVFLAATMAPEAAAVRRLLRSRVLTWLGLVSFGAYLYHFPLERFWSRNALVLDSPWPGATYCVLVAVTTLAGGAASWFLIERPVLRLVGSTAVRRASTQPEGPR